MVLVNEARETDDDAASSSPATEEISLSSPLLAGYQIEVEMSGFKRMTRGPIRVQVESSIRVDFALQVEAFLREQDGVEQTTTVIGGGATRFTLVYEPKEDAAAYAQIIVRTETRDQIPVIWFAVAG